MSLLLLLMMMMMPFLAITLIPAATPTFSDGV